MTGAGGRAGGTPAAAPGSPVPAAAPPRSGAVPAPERSPLASAGAALRRSYDATALLAAVLLLVAALGTFASGHVRSDLLLFTGQYADRAHQADLYQMWAVGALTATHPDIYSETARQELGALMQARAQHPGATTREQQAARYWGTAAVTGTPVIYAAFGYLQTGEWELDSTVFQLLSLAALIGSILWLGRRVRLGRAATLLLAGVVVATSEPLFLDLGWGNVNSLQVAMLAGYLALRSGRPTDARTLAAGALLGVAILLKPNLGLVVPLLGLELLFARRWRDAAVQLGGLALAGVGALALTFLRYGSLEPWSGWITTFQALAPGYAAPGYSVPATILRLTGVESPAASSVTSMSGLLLVSLLVTVALVLAWSRPSRASAGAPLSAAGEDRRWGRETLLLGIAAGVTVLGYPFAWYHYFVLLTPLLVLLLRPGPDALGGTPFVGLRQVATAVALFFLSGVLAQVFAAQWDAVPHLVSLAVGAAILVAVALFELSGRAQVSRAGVPPPVAAGG